MINRDNFNNKYEYNYINNDAITELTEMDVQSIDQLLFKFQSVPALRYSILKSIYEHISTTQKLDKSVQDELVNVLLKYTPSSLAIQLIYEYNASCKQNGKNIISLNENHQELYSFYKNFYDESKKELYAHDYQEAFGAPLMFIINNLSIFISPNPELIKRKAIQLTCDSLKRKQKESTPFVKSLITHAFKELKFCYYVLQYLQDITPNLDERKNVLNYMHYIQDLISIERFGIEPNIKITRENIAQIANDQFVQNEQKHRQYSRKLYDTEYTIENINEALQTIAQTIQDQPPEIARLIKSSTLRRFVENSVDLKKCTDPQTLKTELLKEKDPLVTAKLIQCYPNEFTKQEIAQYEKLAFDDKYLEAFYGKENVDKQIMRMHFYYLGTDSDRKFEHFQTLVKRTAKLTNNKYCTDKINSTLHFLNPIDFDEFYQANENIFKAKFHKPKTDELVRISTELSKDLAETHEMDYLSM